MLLLSSGSCNLAPVIRVDWVSTNCQEEKLTGVRLKFLSGEGGGTGMGNATPKLFSSYPKRATLIFSPSFFAKHCGNGC